ncbi:MAG: serine/threonine-protein kinase [Bryobacteraceae bacterium]
MSDRLRRVEEIFQAAYDLSPEQRGAYLASASGGDEELAADVASLLDAANDGDVTHVVARIAGEWADGQEPRAGARIGAYEIVRELGHGGMGSVYLAKRWDDAYARQVALKLLHPAHASPNLVARFQAERRFLASLQHPNVASVYDAGTTAEGVPYLVMEYVEGERLDLYCRNHAVPRRQRLEIFRKICGAVQHAHRNLIVHRDLKPANIIVNGDGEPKLLDFGIAKLTESAGDESPRLTGTYTILMTPDYASPEQARGEPVTTSTDIYSLGVILYEVISGRRPYQIRSRSVTEIARTVGETGAEPLASGEDDLDRIAAKALEKDPALRYESAEQFSADVGRLLSGMPVIAREQNWSYRAGTFVRRHRLAVAASAAVLAVIVGFGIAMAVLASRLAEQRDVARQEQVRAREAARFLTSIFEAAAPDQSGGEKLTAEEVLDRGALRVDRELQGQPELLAAVKDSIANTFRSLGQYPKALTQAQQGLESRRKRYGSSSEEVAAGLATLGGVYYDTGQYEACLKALLEALAIREKNGRNRAGIADSLLSVSDAYDATGDSRTAEEYARRAMATFREADGAKSAAAANAMVSLAALLRHRGEFTEAEALLGESLTIRRALFGENHLDVAHSLNHLGRLHYQKGEYATAEPLVREALEIRRRVMGPNHLSTVASNSALAGILSAKGDNAAAEAAYRESMRMLNATFGDNHPFVAAAAYSIAATIEDGGEFERAEAEARRALDLHRSLVGKSHPNTARALMLEGRLLTKLGRTSKAEPLLREGLRIRSEKLTAPHFEIAEAEALLGECLMRQGRLREAEPLLTGSYPVMAKQRGDVWKPTRATRESIQELYRRLGAPEKAAAVISSAAAH